MLERTDHLLPGSGRPRVLPCDLLALGEVAAEARATAHEIVALLGELQRRRPLRRQRAAVVDRADARVEANAEVGRRVDCKCHWVEFGTVVLRAQAAVDDARTDAMTRREREAAAQLHAAALEAIAVGVAIGRAGFDRRP